MNTNDIFIVRKFINITSEMAGSGFLFAIFFKMIYFLAAVIKVHENKLIGILTGYLSFLRRNELGMLRYLGQHTQNNCLDSLLGFPIAEGHLHHLSTQCLTVFGRFFIHIGHSPKDGFSIRIFWMDPSEIQIMFHYLEIQNLS